ncbi:hypothetical protein SVAN01_02164 [Stagonosporopsis vannaccii]|nr:hypothetical protein SVAN01_02164 [Stagonosporopsis vannaccii]
MRNSVPIPQNSHPLQGGGEEWDQGPNDGSATFNENRSQDISTDTPQEAYIAVACEDLVDDVSIASSASSAKTYTPNKARNTGKGNPNRSSSHESQYKILQGRYPKWIRVSGPEPGQPPVYHQSSALELEEPSNARPVILNDIHLAAAARLAPDERLQLLNKFLNRNAVRLGTFYARMQPYQVKDASCHHQRVMETSFSASWDDENELELLTDAVLWVDALLSAFRADILAEDISNLQPRLIETTESALSDKERALIDRYHKQIIDVQTSNSYRNQLLHQINIDVAIFESLLQSAEIIRYRHKPGNGYGQKDDLVDGLRRIYSTLVCTIPVGLLEDDRPDQPAQAREKQHGIGLFTTYNLPSRPELFDHNSIAVTRTSSQEYTGIELSERQNPLSREYWRDMHDGMMQVVAAQKQDETGRAKLGKDLNSMNRDFAAFYTLIYRQNMAKYVSAAAQRIEEEQHKDIENQTRGHKGQSSPRLSDCSELSEASIQLNLGDQLDQKPARKGRFCLLANKPGGCRDKKRCGYDSHNNEGRQCDSGNECAYGEKCAFLHTWLSNSVQRGYGTVRSSSSDARLVDLYACDLRPILEEVLADPRRYKVCAYINTSKGCKPNKDTTCRFNHTLKGLVCKDYQRGNCPRGDLKCPLWHIAQNETTSSTPESPWGNKRKHHDYHERAPGSIESDTDQTSQDEQCNLDQNDGFGFDECFDRGEYYEKDPQEIGCRPKKLKRGHK